MHFSVPPDFPFMPVKEFLRKYCGISLTLWRKIKRADKVYVNNLKVIPAIAMVKGTDTISYTIDHSSAIEPMDLPLSIVYEDTSLLVVDKPAGQLVHPTTANRYDTIGNAVLNYYQNQRLPYAFHPVHRLDKNTSGLVLIAKQPQIQHLLSADLRTFHRLYLAVTHGIPQQKNSIINAPIARCPDSIIKRMVSADGQIAITHYRVLRTLPTAALVALHLETGRTHQIRVHLASIGHPLLGDDLYGGSKLKISRQALHAARLRFIHPLTKQLICLNSRLPYDMQQLLN